MAQLRKPTDHGELKARGWEVNRKRVQRLMREDNLLCVVKRKFVVTTDSAHGRKVYPNLAASMILTGGDQLWVADITYIRLEEEFVFLAVILDAYSKRVIGWHLDDGLDDSLTLAALRMALRERTVRPRLVHHSDRGGQYASGDYTDLLKDNGIDLSMSRKANPWDNAGCESFMKTLIQEEVYRTEYRNLLHPRARIGEFLEKVYNEKRLHSALDYRSPVQFERTPLRWGLLTLAIIRAACGSSKPLSAISAANRRMADICTLMLDADRSRFSRVARYSCTAAFENAAGPDVWQHSKKSMRAER